ncbi:MAG: TonB-dependent receptor [Bacteroidota bacterium]|nr:TonB-dependent receptor [Bacteroidota bacterium]
MMRSFAAAIIILNVIHVSAAGQEGFVKGKITDKNSAEPLPGTYVLYGKQTGTVSDRNGHYLIKVNSGRLSLTFQLLGYETIAQVVTVLPKDTMILDVALQMKVSEINQVVVSADRTEKKVAELSVSMDVIKSSFLAENNITDSQEIINKTTGIEVMDGQASVRGGSGYSYGVGSRVLALIDGLPMLSADAGNIKWQFLPLENISQVEIIKGASSVLYGSSALNGIINFRTADAGNIPVTKAFAEGGVYGTPRNRDWKWWDTPRLFTSAAFSHLQKSGNTGIGLSASFLLDNGYRRLNDEKLWRLNLKLKHTSKKVDGLYYGFNVNTGYTDKRDFVLWENAETGALRQNPTTALENLGSFVSVDPFITFNKTGRFRHDLKFRLQYSGNKLPESEQNNSNAWSLYSEYQLWHKITDWLDVTAGLAEFNSDVTSNFFGDHHGLNIAGYSQFEVKPIKRIEAVAGIRIEQNSLDNKYDRIVPVFRAGINYHVAEYTFLRASFGQGYRYPSIAEKFASTTLASVKVFPNPDVKAEQGWNTEAGIKQGLRIGKTEGQADLSVFLTRNSQLIEYIFSIYTDPVTGIPGFGFKAINVEQSQIFGYEFEILLNRISGDFNASLNAGYTYVNPVEFNKNTHHTTDTYLKYRRKHSGKIAFQLSWKNVGAGLGLYAKSKILNIDDVFLNPLTRESILPGFYDYWTNDNKGYFVMDGNIDWKFTSNLDLSLVVKNITNTEYMGRPADIQPPRNFSLRLSGKF